MWTEPRATDRLLDTLAAGVVLEDGEHTQRAAIAREADNAFTIELREGKKRQIRRMCEGVGLRVVRLVRTRFGPLTIGRLQPGGTRHLGRGEREQLWDAAGLRERRLRPE